MQTIKKEVLETCEWAVVVAAAITAASRLWFKFAVFSLKATFDNFI